MRSQHSCLCDSQFLNKNTTIVIIKKHVIHHEVHEGHEVHKTSNGIDGASFFKYCLRELRDLRGKKLMKARFIGFYNSLVRRKKWGYPSDSPIVQQLQLF
jgi:hypothetical protein